MFNIPTVTVAKTTLEAAAETVTLTYVAPSVSWTPMHLVIRWSARSNEEVDVERGVSLRLNEDTGTNYNDQRLDGAVEAETAGRTTDATNIASTELIQVTVQQLMAGVVGSLFSLMLFLPELTNR
jgi:hypothetical protein